MSIHASCVISPEAKIASDVVLGPFCVIEGDVEIGSGTILESNVRIGSKSSKVVIGKNNHIYSGAVIGGSPQDKKYAGEKTELHIGDGNQIREYVTLNIGTVKGGGKTIIGNENLIMAYCHVGHDCHIGNKNVLANSVNLAGHVTVQNNVTIGGMSGVSQFSRLGNFCFIAGFSAINKDILPYTIASGIWATSRVVNKIGLERNGFTKEEIQSIHKAVRIITKTGKTVVESLQEIETQCEGSERLKYLTDFVKESERGIAI